MNCDETKGNAISVSAPRPEIEESWRRCKAAGVDPLKDPFDSVLPVEELNCLKDANRAMLDATGTFFNTLPDALDEADFQIVVTDHNGVVLERYINKEKSGLKQAFTREGVDLSERVSGTTAVGLAIYYKTPFYSRGDEHYNKALRSWSCYAAPVFDADHNLLGVISAESKSSPENHYALAMIGATAIAIENEIAFKNINRSLSESNNQLEATLSAVSDGVVYVKDNRIVQINSTMSQFIGKNEEEVIGAKVGEAIIAFPGIEECLRRIETDNLVEVMITGVNQNYNCLLAVQPVDEMEMSYVMIFTQTEEIRMLAIKLNKFNAYFTFEDIIGKSLKLREAVKIARKAASYNFKIILEGECGTGKEMFAQAIHNASSKKSKPFIAVDCAAIPHELIEEELFGSEENLFSKVIREKKTGKFELANGGTIFLDAINSLPMDIQAKLLRVLQEEKLVRVGGTTPIPLDARVIVASNTSLEHEVKNGNFRKDLFYRLNVVFIKIPSLRERREDILPLVDHFLKKGEIKQEYSIDKKAMDMLERYSWPGNVRQLHNAVERAIMMCEGNVINKEHFSLDILSGTDRVYLDSNEEIGTLDDVIRSYVMKVLDYAGGNISEASRLLNISRSTIYNYLSLKEK